MLESARYVHGCWRSLIFTTAVTAALVYACWQVNLNAGSVQRPTGSPLPNAGLSSVIAKNDADNPVGPAIYIQTMKLSPANGPMHADAASDVSLARLAREFSHSSSLQMVMAGGALPQHIYLAMVAAASLDKDAKRTGALPPKPVAAMRASATLAHGF